MEERKKTGRPRAAPDKELVHGTLRLTRAQWEKVRMAGVPALRLLIDRWRPELASVTRQPAGYGLNGTTARSATTKPGAFE